MRQAIAFLEWHLEDAPKDLESAAESLEKLRSKFKAGRVEACKESDEGSRLRRMRERRKCGPP